MQDYYFHGDTGCLPPYWQYGMGQGPVPIPDMPYTYPYNLPAALLLIRESVASERKDEMFYQYLLDTAPDRDKEIIRSIRDDERKHFSLFRGIYTEITGQMLPPPAEVSFTPPDSYCDGLRQALFGELGAVEKYRRILFAMEARPQVNKLIEIITDEQKHADKWNYLFSLNECYEQYEEED